MRWGEAWLWLFRTGYQGADGNTFVCGIPSEESSIICRSCEQLGGPLLAGSLVPDCFPVHATLPSTALSLHTPRSNPLQLLMGAILWPECRHHFPCCTRNRGWPWQIADRWELALTAQPNPACCRVRTEMAAKAQRWRQNNRQTDAASLCPGCTPAL